MHVGHHVDPAITAFLHQNVHDLAGGLVFEVGVFDIINASRSELVHVLGEFGAERHPQRIELFHLQEVEEVVHGCAPKTVRAERLGFKTKPVDAL